jgi:hypothetical protein
MQEGKVMASQERYVKFIKDSSPTARKEIYKARQKQLKEEAVKEYKAPEERRKSFVKRLKNIDKALSKKLTSRRLIKSGPRATYQTQAPADYSRSSFFNNQYEKEKNLLTWK